MIWLPTLQTFDSWSISTRKDRVRGIEDYFYEASRDLWLPIEKLSEVLGKLKEKRRIRRVLKEIDDARQDVSSATTEESKKDPQPEG
jgi:hypothetical protein